MHIVSCFILYILGCIAFSFVLVRPTPDSVSSTNRSWLFGVPGSCKPIWSCTSQDYSYRPRCAYALHYICIIVLFCISCAFVMCFFCVLTLNRDWRSARRLSRLGLCFHSQSFCARSLLSRVLSYLTVGARVTFSICVID